MATIKMNGKEVNIEDIPPRSITIEQYQTVRANTEGFNQLLPKLDNEAIKWVFKWVYEPNASYRLSGGSYNDMLIGHFIPELLNRLMLQNTQSDPPA